MSRYRVHHTNQHLGRYFFFFVRPIPGTLAYQGPSTVLQYKVLNVELCSDTIDDVAVVFVQISLKRDLIGSLINDFLPIVLSIVIGHLTNYVNSFEVAMGTNLTLLLVLVTL